MDILVQTMRKEGFFALYKGSRPIHILVYVNAHSVLIPSLQLHGCAVEYTSLLILP